MKTLLLSISFLVATQTTFSQATAEPIFKNPVLISGTALQNGAEYKFSNVTVGVDAVLKIVGRSEASVVLTTIDNTATGFDNALQPEMGITGTVPANKNYWVDFEISFYEAGSTTKIRLEKINMTEIDIDGDGQSLSEYVQMNEVTSCNLSLISLLSMNVLNTLPVNPFSLKPEFNYNFSGPTLNYAGIDTSAVKVMVTSVFEQKEKISFRLGAQTGSSTTTAGVRMSSLWFRSFNLNPAPITLPVKLTYFSAMLNNNKVDLKWQTSSEINVSHFIVERSTDGTNFSEAGMVFAFGNTTTKSDYAYSDNISALQGGIVYYRLCSVDVDGKTSYSQIRIIRIGKQSDNNVTILTYPNPVTNEVRITIPANWQNKKTTYEVYSINGQVAKKIEAANSSQTATINISSLNSGLYIVKVSCEGQTAQQKIVKQ